MNTKVACQYAIVRFLPYAETGEFANVGVVVACPERGYLKAKFTPVARTQRITTFFDGLDARIYRESLKYLIKEIERVANDVEHGKIPAGFAFDGVTRPREALMTFGAARAMLADTPDLALDALYKRFIERDFATKEYHEQILTNGVGRLLAGARLKPYFEDRLVGDDAFNVKFPFVATHIDAPKIVIKPLYLAHDEANKIYDHGGAWVTRVRRLKKHQLLDADMALFAIDEAQYDGNEKRRRAAREIVSELKDLGAHVVDATNKSAILEFAELAKPTY
jgi:hypothetical protein